MASSGRTPLARREASIVSGSVKCVFDWFLRVNKNLDRLSGRIYAMRISRTMD